MSPENVHDSKDNHHFTIVLVPGGESSRTRTISVSKVGLYAIVIGGFVLAVVGIFSLIVYTPVRSLLPVSNPELERRYGAQILQIQEEVSRLVEEMNVLRSYNLRLRKALGEPMTSEDSTLIASYDPAAEAKNASVTENPQPAVSGADMTATEESPPQISAQTMPANIAESRFPGAQPAAGTGYRFDLPLAKPADGYVTRRFDITRYHYGIDFAGKRSSSVLAAADGNVLFSGWTYDDGFMIMIAHPRGYLSVYKHNESLLKYAGASVRRGEPIALLGNTGRTSSGPHLHFELWKDGIAYDPGQFLLTTP